MNFQKTFFLLTNFEQFLRRIKSPALIKRVDELIYVSLVIDLDEIHKTSIIIDQKDINILMFFILLNPFNQF